MRKLVQFASTAVLGVGLFAGSTAFAATSCPNSTIKDTGNGSKNTIICSTTADTHVTCVNDVYVVGENGQAASTGNANSGGNTSGGVTVTGNATNDNNQTVKVGASCGTTLAVTTPTTPTIGGGKGAGTPAAPATTPVASLPNTGSDTVQNDAVIGVVVLGGALAASQFGVAAYRRLALK